MHSNKFRRIFQHLKEKNAKMSFVSIEDECFAVNPKNIASDRLPNFRMNSKSVLPSNSTVFMYCGNAEIDCVSTRKGGTQRISIWFLCGKRENASDFSIYLELLTQK